MGASTVVYKKSFPPNQWTNILELVVQEVEGTGLEVSADMSIGMVIAITYANSNLSAKPGGVMSESMTAS